MVKQIKTEKDLIREAIFSYRKSRKVKYPNRKVSRGRSHSISSIFEDMFANYLSNNINCDFIYIDQPLSIDGLGKRNPYLDIVIVRNKKITALLDTKTDLGWGRDKLFDLCRKKSELVKLIRNKKCSIIIGKSKEKKDDLIISNRIVYDVVILSSENINKEKLNNQISEVKKLKPSVDVFILTKGKHPNTYNIGVNKLLSQIEINNNEFQRLLKKLKNINK